MPREIKKDAPKKELKKEIKEKEESIVRRGPTSSNLQIIPATKVQDSKLRVRHTEYTQKHKIDTYALQARIGCTSMMHAYHTQPKTRDIRRA